MVKSYFIIGIAVWVKVYNGQLITTMAHVNNGLNQLVQTFVDPALGLEGFTTGGASHVDLNNQLFLEIQVSQM